MRGRGRVEEGEEEGVKEKMERIHQVVCALASLWLAMACVVVHQNSD